MEANSQKKSICGVIPAYMPDDKLIVLVKEVLALDFLVHLMIVDDASGNEFEKIFSQLNELPRVTVLYHAVNQGTGGATKTAFNHILCEYPDVIGAVTFDADGQHLPKDVKKVVTTFKANQDKLILGVRNFYAGNIKIPFRSKIGNRLTEIIFTGLTGICLKDTQTGLRCYNPAMMQKCLAILHSRYEFQLEALLCCIADSGIVQVPIETIYEDNNKCSHFNPVLDSIRIYLVFFRFIAASLTSSCTDYLIFSILLLGGSSILVSLTIARIISVTLNFILARHKVFKARGSILKQAAKYIFLALFLVTTSYFSITFLKTKLSWSPLLSKFLVETTLFMCSFLVQNIFIFPRHYTKNRLNPESAQVSFPEVT